MKHIPPVTDGHLGGYICGGGPQTWTPKLWAWIVNEYNVKSVLDIGCGEGHSTKFFHMLGCDVLGIEGSQQAINNSVTPDRIVKHDYCEGPFIPKQKYDLVWASEFVEHVEEKYINNILKTFSFAKKLILMTFATPGQGGYHHVNEQPASYWIDLLSKMGYQYSKELTKRTRSLATIEIWYNASYGARVYASSTFYAKKGLSFIKGKLNE